MKYIVNKIYSWIMAQVELFKPDDFCESKYLYLDRNTVLINYIENKARELSDNENIKIYSVSYDELNKDELDENEKAVGVFKYLKGNARIEYEKINSEYDKIKHIKRQKHLDYPRIEITEKGDIFTILHELGHYFLYKRNKIQSELGANLFVEEFFDNYLPPFFKWIYQIDIIIRTKKQLDFTKEEAREHWNEYNKWIKINE